jgi:hypothetical protein
MGATGPAGGRLNPVADPSRHRCIFGSRDGTLVPQQLMMPSRDPRRNATIRGDPGRAPGHFCRAAATSRRPPDGSRAAPSTDQTQPMAREAGVITR